MAVKGNKTTLEFGDAATAAGSVTWTPVAAILDITPPKIEGDDIETTNMDNPIDASGVPFKTFDPGFADAGTVDCKIQFSKAQNAALYALFRIQKGWRMRFPDAPSPSGSKWEWDGYIKSFANEVDREQLVTADISIKVSGGKPVFTPGT